METGRKQLKQWVVIYLAGTLARGNRGGRRGPGKDCRRDNLASKVPLVLRSEKMKEGTTCAKGVPGRGNCLGKGPEAGTCLVCLKNSKEMIEEG